MTLAQFKILAQKHGASLPDKEVLASAKRALLAIGVLAWKRAWKSLRSIIRATVYFAASWIMPRAPSGSLHSLL